MEAIKSCLKFMRAPMLRDKRLELQGVTVRNGAGEALGAVDGCVAHGESGRPFYVILHGGNALTSKRFPIPIGQIYFDPVGDDAPLVFVTKAQLGRLPEIPCDTLDELDADQIKRMNDAICEVFDPGELPSATEPYDAMWNRPSYRVPEWWPS
jgi:hypothetical protein